MSFYCCLFSLVLWMSVWAHGFKHFWLASVHFICYACANLRPYLGNGSIFRLGPKSFAHTLEVLASFSLFFHVFCFVICLLIWQDSSSSFCTAFAQPWNYPFLQAALSFFSVKWYLKTIVWVLEELIALGYCFLAFFIRQSIIHFLR